MGKGNFRGGGFPGGGGFGGGGGGNMQQLMKQAQKMQADMLAAQEALADLTVEHSAGGMVTVTATGDKRITSIKIEPEALEDAEMLQDMVLVAVNGALEKAEEAANEKMSKVTGGLPPGLF